MGFKSASFSVFQCSTTRPLFPNLNGVQTLVGEILRKEEGYIIDINLV